MKVKVVGQILTFKFLSSFVFICLSNLPFWLLSAHYFVLRPIFNLDILVALLAWGISAPMGLLVLGLVWLVDGLQSLSLVYHFPSPLEFIKSAKFADHLDWSDMLSVGLLPPSTVVFVSLACMWYTFKRSRPHWFSGLIFTGLLIIADVVNGSSMAPWLGKASFLMPVNISGSPGMNLAMAANQAHERAAHPLKRLNLEESPDFVSWAADIKSSGNVFIVIVESLGQHKSVALQQWLDSKLLGASLESRWKISIDQTPFEGSTTAGELRVLCHLGGHYTRLTQETVQYCLPLRLANLGYQTFGLHGFSSKMFDRGFWWPTIGLQHLTFGESMPSSVDKCGGAFRGVCDTAMLDRAADLLTGNHRLVYLLTLNTHLPLITVELPSDLKKICNDEKVIEEVCQLTGQLGALFFKLSQLLQQVKQPPLVMIVGDHAPPFLVQSQRQQYIASSVPRYILVPR